MTDLKEDRLLTTKEAATFLGVSASTLAKRRVRGAPPGFHKIGRAVRYSLRALLQFAQANVRSSTSQSL